MEDIASINLVAKHLHSKKKNNTNTARLVELFLNHGVIVCSLFHDVYSGCALKFGSFTFMCVSKVKLHIPRRTIYTAIIVSSCLDSGQWSCVIPCVRVRI